MTEHAAPREEPDRVERKRSKRELVSALLRNSPWLSIAALLHLLVFTVFSVVYVTHQKSAERQRDLAVKFAPAPVALPVVAEPPPILDRGEIPLLTPRQTEELTPAYVPDAAVRSGEITDETDPTKEPGIYNPNPEALSSLPSGEPGGTPIGVGAVGHRGAGPSAFTTRNLGPGGKGGGGGGGPDGATTVTREATNAALLWLQRHQSPDGRWSAADFSAQCKRNTCGGAGNPAHDVGITGLALLCYLGAGETHESGAFRDTVKRGLVYLLDEQALGEDGCFGQRLGQHWVYDHACAALAMIEAYGMTQAKVFKEPAQRGLAFVLRLQNPYGAWRYAYPPDGDNDTSVTGWMVMVLKSAHLAGLTIDRSALDNALAFIDETTDAESGRTGYTAMGERPSRLPTLAGAFPPEKSEALTAVGMLVRIFGGHTLEGDPMIAKGADLLVKKLPTWEPDGSIDFYYWYYGTLAMHQVGGARWQRWNEALKSALLDHQRTNPDEDEYGSWDPVDPWASEGGRVYATALNCLSTEVYYRYPRVFGR